MKLGTIAHNVPYTVSKKNIWYCAPLLVIYSLDVASTLLGQPANYWSGDYRDVIEANPISSWFLSINPLSYLLYRIAFFGFITCFVMVLPEIIAKFIATLYFLSHVIGAFGWLKNVFCVGFWERMAILFFLVLLFTYSYSRAEQNRS